MFTEQFQNAYSGIIDWVATEKTYVNVTAGFLGYGLHSAGGDYYHGTRRTFCTTNVGQAGVPAEFQNPSGFADNNSNSFTVADDYQRFNLSAGRDPLREAGRVSTPSRSAGCTSASATSRTWASST